MATKRSQKGSSGKKLLRGSGGKFAVHPQTKALVIKVNKLKPGQFLEVKMPSAKASRFRAESLRDLKAKKKLPFRILFKRGSVFYVLK